MVASRPFSIRIRRSLTRRLASCRALPFAGNLLPKARFDPLTSSLMGKFWDPSGPGDNITGVNNFKSGYVETYNYYNFSDRVDYNINDAWRVYGRIGRYHTTDISPNATPNQSELVHTHRHVARGHTDLRRRRLDRQLAHRRELPRRLA